MQLLKNKKLATKSLNRACFINLIFLVFLGGCSTKIPQSKTENYQAAQVKQAKSGSNYIICKGCVEYKHPAALDYQEESTINNKKRKNKGGYYGKI